MVEMMPRGQLQFTYILEEFIKDFASSGAGQSDEVHYSNLSPPDDVSNMGILLIRDQ